ncbi:MAG: hypothetical protein U0531_17875 [Dehalococcoidia bacterium]
MQHPARARVLVVDQDPTRGARLAGALTHAGFQVSLHTDSFDGLLVVEDEDPSAVVLSWDMPFIPADVFLRALETGLSRPPPGGHPRRRRRHPGGGRGPPRRRRLPDSVVQAVRRLLGVR